jgi:hypothetical protein
MGVSVGPGEITAKGQELRLEPGIGKVSDGLGAGACGVIGEMSNRATILDGTSNLPDLRHIPATDASLPRLVDQLHIDEEMDVVGDLSIGLFDRKHAALRNSGRQAVDG